MIGVAVRSVVIDARHAAALPATLGISPVLAEQQIPVISLVLAAHKSMFSYTMAP